MKFIIAKIVCAKRARLLQPDHFKSPSYAPVIFFIVQFFLKEFDFFPLDFSPKMAWFVQMFSVAA